MLKKQLDAINFLLKYPDKWHSFNQDITEIIYSLVNLGIVKINQFRLKSPIKANQFLTSKKD